MFITQEDLYSKIRPNEIQQITGGDDFIVTHSISYAISEVESYLAKRYDTDKIFAEYGDNRNPMLMSFVVDIAIYEIGAIARPGMDITDRRERRNRAIDYLKQVKNHDLSMPLPLRPTIEDAPDDTPVEYGCKPKRNNYL